MIFISVLSDSSAHTASASAYKKNSAVPWRIYLEVSLYESGNLGCLQ
jgi:hypothetical protein